jgi:tetratricopeptide (TPR) repeat protein
VQLEVATTVLGPLSVAFGLTLLVLGAPATAQDQFSVAQAHAIQLTKDWNRLLAYGKAWTAREPRNPEAWHCLAIAYGSADQGLRQPQEALRAYQRVVDLAPQLDWGWYGLGSMQLDADHCADAIASFARSAQISEHIQTYFGLFNANFCSRQFVAANQALIRIGNMAKTQRDWFVLGNFYYGFAPFYGATAAYEKAKAAYRQALQFGETAAIWTNLGTVEQSLGNPDAALADYAKGAQMGDAQGRQNAASLREAIRVCMNRRQQLINANIWSRPQAVNFNAQIVYYNQSCSSVTGDLKSNIIVFPRF